MQDGVSLTWAELTMETDVNIAAQNIRDKISAIRQDLPADIEEPMITRYDPLAAFPVISLAVTTTSDLSLVEKNDSPCRSNYRFKRRADSRARTAPATFRKTRAV